MRLLWSVAMAAGVAASAPAAAAEVAPVPAATNPFLAEPAAAGTARQPRYGFSVALGTGGSAGDLGTVLRFPISGDFNFFRQKGAWRFGLGIDFTSFTMEQPYDQELEWGLQRTYLFATRVFRQGRPVQPYVQLRAGLARLHPRSELFAFDPPPEEPGDSPTKASNGWSAGIVPGLELRLSRSTALDLSGQIDYYSVTPYDLSPIGHPDEGTGFNWEFRLGLRWHPDDGWPSGPPQPGHPDRARDAWGVSRNTGWAIAETLAINWAASGINEYVRNQNFNQISPRSWWDNLEHGFTYDDNEFKTNQFVHPWNGSAYFNSARSNGSGFWGSVPYALGGAFFWECCGETHPMSFNDLVSTGIGGIAFGEAVYRVSSQLLDNRSKGKSRFFREAGGLLIDPARGFNRFVSGRASRVGENPEDPMDWRGNHARFFVFAGARVIGEGESISENTNSYGLIGLNHAFGSVFDNTRRKPFDSFSADVVLSPGDKQLRTVFRVRGDLYSRPLGGASDAPRYAFSIVQHFDYYNNNAYEFGQQAFGPSLFARYRLSRTLGLNLRWDGMIPILAAVNADYSYLADVADPERLREYDYGPGLGTGFEAALSHKGRPILGLYYRFHWIDVSNGSIYNQQDENELGGSSADHYLQAAGARLFIPIHGKLGLGADGLVVLRKSYYSAPDLEDKDQRNPEFRIYLAFDLGH